MVSWYWVPIFMLVAGVVVFGLCRYFDKKLDAISNQLKNLISK